MDHDLWMMQDRLLGEAKVLEEAWRKTYNRIRPDISLGERPPAPEALMIGNFTLGLAQCPRGGAIAPTGRT